MFPPPKKPAGPGGPPPKSGLPGPGGPPPGPGGPPPGGDPFGPAPAGGPAMPPGMDPFGGGAMPPLGMGAGMPKPGQGMDPMMAMMNGLGPDPSMESGAPPSQGPPMGPDGFPVGGSSDKATRAWVFSRCSRCSLSVRWASVGRDHQG